MQRSWPQRDGRQIGVAEDTRQPEQAGRPSQEAPTPYPANPATAPHLQGAPPAPQPQPGSPATGAYGAPYVGPFGPGAAQPSAPFGAPGTGALPGFSGPLGQSLGLGQGPTSGQIAGQRAQPNLDELANRAMVLLQRLRDVERSLTGQEWWLLGKVAPEARLLAELASLLAVARGEMEGFLTDFCQRHLAPFAPPEPTPEATDEVLASMNDPRWLSAQREQAIGHLRMVAAALPAMSQYAHTLRVHAERLGVTPAALDPLTIVMDRLNDAQETLQQPPA